MSEEYLTHVTNEGDLTMVDVGHKSSTRRRAIVRTRVLLSEHTFALLTSQALPKGDVLTTAKVAGIQAGKQTGHLIPLCHPLFLSYLEVDLSPDPDQNSIEIMAEARTTAETGVEMEALVAAQVAAMTIYDMCKAVQRDIIISDCRLVHKSGGQSGTYDQDPIGQRA
jgi:cyclic pyranopterin phosphate synthase